jgi:uncharacterized protein YgiM (DUF1202 family)
MNDLEKYHSIGFKKRCQQFLLILLICMTIPYSGVLNSLALTRDVKAEDVSVNDEIVELKNFESANIDEETITSPSLSTSPETLAVLIQDDVYVEDVKINENTANIESPKAEEEVVSINNLEIVYTKTIVNVRAGAGKDYELLGTVGMNEPIIKIGEEGNWTKIKYQNASGYISSDYVVGNQPTEADTAGNVVNSFVKYGTAGRLYVNGTSVAVYNDGEAGSQATVNAVDSASMYRIHGTTTICDHVNQGFSAIKGVQVGDECYIEYADGSRLELVCIGTDQGHNLLTDLVDHDYKSVYGAYPIIMYTCNECWQNVTLVFWDIK